MKHALACLVLAGLPVVLSAQTHPAAQAARAWRVAHERAVLDEFIALLRIPNVATDRANIRRNADHILKMMASRGVAGKLVTVGDANPVVFGEIRAPGATRTIVFYAHYDGAPLDPGEWSADPFTPAWRTGPLDAGGQPASLPPPGEPVPPEWRLYARSAGDDKAPIVALLTALDGIRAAGLELRSNVKFVFDGEEEAGSPNLTRILTANAAMFSGDVWLMCDGPVHQTRRPLIYFGARDVTRLDITLYGPNVELHSGHYGNWAPNPAMLLARLLASMKDEDGRVLIGGFYDGIEPLGAAERLALAEAPAIDADLRREFGLGSTEGAPAPLVELITRPSLNIRGLASSRVGAGASNVIPSTATVSLDIRLVKGMDPRTTQDRVIHHIRQQGFFVVEDPPPPEVRQAQARVAWVERGPAGAGAVRTPMDLPIAQDVIRAVESVLGPAVKLPNMGGTLPLGEIEQALGTRTIIVPIANHDNRQHSFDENLRVQNLWDAIELMAALLTM